MGIQTRQCVPSHEPLLYVFLLHIYLVFFGVFQGFEAFSVIMCFSVFLVTGPSQKLIQLKSNINGFHTNWMGPIPGISQNTVLAYCTDIS